MRALLTPHSVISSSIIVQPSAFLRWWQYGEYPCLICSDSLYESGGSSRLLALEVLRSTTFGNTQRRIIQNACCVEPLVYYITATEYIIDHLLPSLINRSSHSWGSYTAFRSYLPLDYLFSPNESHPVSTYFKTTSGVELLAQVFYWRLLLLT